MHRPYVCVAGKKDRVKAPKIQRLITPAVLQRKRHRVALRRRRLVKSRQDSADYHKLLQRIHKVRLASNVLCA